eukprot:jgi/Psemu1/20308/gm1.20308_g
MPEAREHIKQCIHYSPGSRPCMTSILYNNWRKKTNEAIIDNDRLQARKQSKKKKRKVKELTNRGGKREQDEKEWRIKKWLNLYEKCWNSLEDLEEYNNCPVPCGAWGRDSQTYRTAKSSNRNILQTAKQSLRIGTMLKLLPGKATKIPDSFPGTVLITDTQDVNSINSSPEFKYFMKRILGAVSPKQTDFKRKSVRMTVSNIFTPSNEAFALLFLYNDYDSWLNTTKGMRLRKKFTDGKSGNKEGWSNQGQDLYEYLVSELEERREEQQSKELETELLKIRKRKRSLLEILDEDHEDYKLYLKYKKNEQDTTRDDQAFLLQDVSFYLGSRILPHVGPVHELQAATSVTLTFTTQTNGDTGKVVAHARSGDSLCCPDKCDSNVIKLLARWQSDCMMSHVQQWYLLLPTREVGASI